MCAGPMLQLRPIMSAPDCCNAGANCSGEVPSSVLPSSSIVICATMGRPHTLRTAAIGCSDLVQVPERLEDEEVDSADEECLRLLPEVALGLVAPHSAPRLDAKAERPYCARDIGRSACAFARQAGAGLVDLTEPIGQPECAQLDSIGSKRVRLEDVRPGLRVGMMHRSHTIRIAQVEGVEGAIDEHALRVEHRPHRAVADEDAVVERFEERHDHVRRARPQAGVGRLDAADWLRAGGATSRSLLSHTKSSLL